MGMGGGGDVVSTLPIARTLEALGTNPIVGSLIWERFTFDPIPGPISISELINPKPITKWIAWATPETHAIRNGRKVIPQASVVSRFVKGKKVLVVDIIGGVAGIIEGLKEALNKLKINLVIGLDVGGDVLADGYEEELWSPLADQMMLSALANLAKQGYRVLVGVHGPGVDGEIGLGKVLSKMSQIAKRGGYLGARGLTKEDLDLLDRVKTHVRTEASLIPLEAAKGFFGTIKIRGGSRVATVSLISSITFFFDALAIYEESFMAKAVSRTRSLEEARKNLNNLGIYTELDLEESLKIIHDAGKPINEETLIRLKDEGVRSLRKL
jgi:hypothetical protein